MQSCIVFVLASLYVGLCVGVFGYVFEYVCSKWLNKSVNAKK